MMTALASKAKEIIKLHLFIFLIDEILKLYISANINIVGIMILKLVNWSYDRVII